MLISEIKNVLLTFSLHVGDFVAITHAVYHVSWPQIFIYFFGKICVL